MKCIICNRPPGVYPKMIPIADFYALAAMYAVKKGNDVLLLFTHRNPSAEEIKWLSDNNIKWRVWSDTQFFKKSINSFIKLFRILNEEKPDVVDFSFHSVPLGVFTSTLLGIKHRIIWSHSLFKRDHASLVKKIKMIFQDFRENIYYKISTNVFTCSKAVKNEIVKQYGVDPDKIKEMYLGVHFPRSIESVSGKDRLSIICISRYIKEKGQEFLIRALPKVISKYPDLKVLFIGSGNPEFFVNLASDLNVKDNCQFLGEVSKEEVFYHLSRSYISVFPTLVEGFGLVALDSLICGVPVIASRTGGLVEIIEENKSGILVEPGNTLQLEEEILRLLSDENLCMELSVNGIERSKFFEIHKRAEAYADWLTTNFN